MAFRKIVAGINSILAKARGRQLAPAEQELLMKLVAGATAQVQHEQGMIQARGKEPVSVRLVPQVPVRDREATTAWIGGGARLPSGMGWPQIDGSDLQLLAQLDCARLPPGLWGGLGPRRGWLTVFLDPRSVRAKLLHFTDAGEFRPSPPVLRDCNITGYDGRQRAAASGYAWGFPCWPVDIVPVVAGGNDPRREGRSQIRHERYKSRHDFVDDRRWPFDWATAGMMLDAALARFEVAIALEVKNLEPEALAKSAQAVVDAETAGAGTDTLMKLRLDRDELVTMAAVRKFEIENGIALVERIFALKERIELLASAETFSPAVIQPILAELHSLTWMHKSSPPFYRNGQQLSIAQRYAEGAHVLALPFTTHDTAATSSWVYDYEYRLLEAAKHAYLRDAAALPTPLVADCEQVWRDEAAYEIGGMGHVPWGYVHEFDEGADATLLELPSSQLIGWMFGDVYNLVITVKKKDLARNDFSRPLVQITN